MFFWALVIPLAVALTDGLVAAQTESLTCPDGYTLNAAENNKTCFQVFEDGHVTHSQARDLCQASVKDGQLLQVDSIQSNQMVADKLSRRKRYWIGVIKNENDDAIIDATGSPVPFEAPWAWGEPNDHGKQGEKCVEMIGNRRGAWNDKRCDKKRPFVCQAPAVSVTVDKAIEPTVYDLVSCDFETECSTYDLTGWTLVTQNASFVDHTLRNREGHFVKKNDSDATLDIDLSVKLTEPSCLTVYFWGTRCSAEELRNGKYEEFGDLELRHPTKWKRFEATVGASEHAKVVIHVENSENGPEAVDDIRLEPGVCDLG